QNCEYIVFERAYFITELWSGSSRGDLDFDRNDSTASEGASRYGVADTPVTNRDRTTVLSGRMESECLRLAMPAREAVGCSTSGGLVPWWMHLTAGGYIGLKEPWMRCGLGCPRRRLVRRLRARNIPVLALILSFLSSQALFSLPQMASFDRDTAYPYLKSGR